LAVQKTLNLINQFKQSNENQEQQRSISPLSFTDELAQAQAPVKPAYNKDLAIQNILKTIREKHNLPNNNN
jgi:hypothetical protein